MSDKLQELIIEKGDNKTISENGIKLSIKPYTVLVGENNSGKTNLVNAFYDEWNKKYNIIYFSATNNELDKSEEASTSKKTSPLYRLLAEILRKEKLNLNKEIVDPINLRLQQITNSINKNIAFIENKETILKVADTLSEDAVIKNLIPLKILDKYWENAKEVDPDKIGQGTQRMVIFSLLKYYSEQSEESDKLNFFIIEEPEIYLHPKLKKEFNQILFNISKKDNNQVLVTTHDPYFVEMNVNDKDDKKIIAIRRNKNSGFTEEFELSKSIIPDSHNEINYVVFNLPTGSYLLELYERLKSIKKQQNPSKGFSERFESFLRDNILDKTEYIHDDPRCTWKLTYISRLRHYIAHPKSEVPELKDKIGSAILDLRKLLESEV